MNVVFIVVNGEENERGATIVAFTVISLLSLSRSLLSL